MGMSLVEPSVAAQWDRTFTAGDDKKYPSLEVVRLEKWYFKGKPGRLLEYGHGAGVNMIHFLSCGYTVEAIDVSPEAQKLVKRKLALRPEFSDRASFALLGSGDSRLPYETANFDYVNCISVLSLLGSRERAKALVDEFWRVLKPGGKIIIDVNSKNSDFAHRGKSQENDIYLHSGVSGREPPVPLWCPEKIESFKSLLDRFSVDEVGYAAHKYCGSEIHEFLICARKPE